MKSISLALVLAVLAGLIGLTGAFTRDAKMIRENFHIEEAFAKNGRLVKSITNREPQPFANASSDVNGLTEPDVAVKKVIASCDRVITVSGNAVADAVPDIAYLSMGVSQTAADSKTAYADVSERMTKIIDALKSLKVDAKDIQTSQLSVHPNYSYADNFRGQRGYSATNVIRAVVRNIDSLSEICLKATELGANQNFSIHFGVEDTSALYNKALKKAIENAEGKAKTLAGHLNITVTTPTRIIEDKNCISCTPRIFTNDIMSEAGHISNGEIRVSASVKLVYNF